MKLISLKLDNFRQHKSTWMEFRDGMTAIVGANGTGKSTIVEAVRYALFGASRSSKQDVTYYWSRGGRAKVTLTFEVAGRRWEAMRGINEAHLALVTATGKEMQTTRIRETQDRIEKLLRLNDEQFTNSFCALQKGLAFLTFSTNRKRQDEVGRMLGYERLRLAAGMASERRKQRDSELKGLQEGLGNLELLKVEASDAKKDRVVKQATQMQALALVATCEKALAAATEPAMRAATWIKLEADRQELSAQGRVLATNTARDEDEVKKREAEALESAKLKPEADRCDAHEQRVQRLKLDEQKFATHQRALREAQEAQAKLNEAKTALAALPKGDVQGSAKAVAEATSRLAAARNIREQAIAAWMRSKSDAGAAVAKAETLAKGAAKRLAEARELVKQGKCPQCGQAIGTDFRSALEALEAEETTSAVTAHAAKAALEAAQQEPTAVSAAQMELNAAEAHYTTCQAQSETAQQQNALVVQAATRVESLQEALDRGLLTVQATQVEFDPGNLTKAESELATLRPLRDRYLQVKDATDLLARARADLEATKKAFGELKERASELDRRMAGLGFANREAADAARTGLQRAEGELKVAEAQAKMADHMVKAAEERLDRVQRQIAEVEARQALIAEVQTESKLYRHVGQEMDALRELLNNRIRPNLEFRASNLINRLTNSRYSTIRLDDDFNASVVEDDKTPKSIISGGEEDIVALALRLALSELIQERHGMPMSLLILDEVYGSLDSERRQSVMDQLASLKGRFEQIIVISHIEDTTHVADQSFHLFHDKVARCTTVQDAPDSMPSTLELIVE